MECKIIARAPLNLFLVKFPELFAGICLNFLSKISSLKGKFPLINSLTIWTRYFKVIPLFWCFIQMLKVVRLRMTNDSKPVLLLMFEVKKLMAEKVTFTSVFY